MAELVEAVTDAVGDSNAVDIAAMSTAIGPRFPDEAGDPADLWVRLLELHSLGFFDVSQQVTRRALTSITPPA